MDTVKSNAEAYIVCARTSTKPPKGRRRRNSQSRSSVPCVVEKKNVVVKTKVRFLFCPPKFPLEKRGRKAPLFVVAEDESSPICVVTTTKKKTRVVQKSASSSSSSSLPLLSLHFLFFLFFPESRVFLHLRHVPSRFQRLDIFLGRFPGRRRHWMLLEIAMMLRCHVCCCCCCCCVVVVALVNRTPPETDQHKLLFIM